MKKLVPETQVTLSINNYIVMSYGTYVFTFKDNVHVKL